MAKLSIVNSGNKKSDNVTHVKIVNVNVMRRQRNYLLFLSIVEFVLILWMMN